jgi:methylmalonyl-CoA/ethylmalonyl-CoA epimerase
MSDAPVGLHHIVFCVQPESQEAAADFWRAQGIEFEEIVLPELDLRVLLAWEAGIEVIAPTPGAGPAAAAFATFLAEHGEGVYSTVVKVPDMEAALAAATAQGATVVYRNHMDNSGGHALDEAMLAPLHGMPVTFLETTRPG